MKMYRLDSNMVVYILHVTFVVFLLTNAQTTQIYKIYNSVGTTVTGFVAQKHFNYFTFSLPGGSGIKKSGKK